MIERKGVFLWACYPSFWWWQPQAWPVELKMGWISASTPQPYQMALWEHGLYSSLWPWVELVLEWCVLQVKRLATDIVGGESSIQEIQKTVKMCGVLWGAYSLEYDIWHRIGLRVKLKKGSCKCRRMASKAVVRRIMTFRDVSILPPDLWLSYMARIADFKMCWLIWIIQVDPV